jgi:hypothetical protein
MANNTIPISAGSTSYGIDQILQATQQPAKQPGAFRRVLGAVVGGAGNLFAPGIGGLIGAAIGGGGLTGGVSIGGIGIGTGGTDPMQYLQLQQQMSQQMELFETASQILKSRHDASMQSIRNIS